MLLGIPANLFTASVAAGAVDISVSICLLFEASSLICKDPSHSDNVSISFVLLELILVSHSLHYMLWDALNINNFYFLFFYFSILLLFFFCFFFFLKSDEEAHDNEVT